MPLTTVAPNRKDSGPTNGRVIYNRVEELGQSEGLLIRSGSESDSLLDLYRSNPSSGNISQQATDNDIPENMYRPQEDDPEGWIHRDKLAKIESEELQAAGLNLATARRNGPKTLKRDTSLGRPSEEKNGYDSRAGETDGGRPRVAQPQPLEEIEDDQPHWDFRTPEEIAADQSSQIYLTPMARKSGSKIPVLTTSPLPIPQERIDRDTPLVRKRTISNSMSPEDGIPVLKSRTRRGSTGSQQLLQDEVDSLANTPVPTSTKSQMQKSGSPTKTKAKPVQPSPPGTSGDRKVSGTARKPSTNNKTGVTPSPNQRPGTRSGELDRPRTAVNRPEGDPPWLATMYKPDPRLPPDQQIIPTHARRQQQVQWDEEGAIPNTYDRNFSPLAIHSPNGLVNPHSPNLPSSPSPNPGKTPDANAWPLKTTPSVRNSVNGRPGTAGSSNAGYSTMPRVQSPAVIQSPRMGSISSTPGQPPPSTRMQVQRLEHNDMDEKVKDKGCGCCVVM